MDHVLFLVGTVILICILMNRWVEKLAVPSLLVFIALGMCFGENGLLHIQFDDYAAVNTICSVSLIFIMFYGGFGTNLTAARPWQCNPSSCPPWAWPVPPAVWRSLSIWCSICPGQRACL